MLICDGIAVTVLNKMFQTLHRFLRSYFGYTAVDGSFGLNESANYSSSMNALVRR